ncbi:MAG: CDP-diacylglycerol--serine O-phosphatidyltransferase [Myxococcota bacterium]
MNPPGERRQARRARRVRRRRARALRGERRVVFLLPNLITTAALLLGFWSIISAAQGRFQQAALGIVLAGIADLLDGRVARATGTQSRFGAEYDSLSDVVAFGLAPALLFYHWALLPLGSRGWAIAALFAVCAALRLARFNASEAPGSRDFQGLPSTFAGGMVAVIVWFVSWVGIEPPFGSAFGTFLVLAFAGLALGMVSSVPYFSLKSLRLPHGSTYPALVALVLALVVLLLYPEPVMFTIGVGYVLSGPIRVLKRWRARAREGASPLSPSAPLEPREESGPDVR